MAEHDSRETDALLDVERGGSTRRFVRVTHAHYEPKSKWAGIRHKVRTHLLLPEANSSCSNHGFWTIAAFMFPRYIVPCALPLSTPTTHVIYMPLAYSTI